MGVGYENNCLYIVGGQYGENSVNKCYATDQTLCINMKENKVDEISSFPFYISGALGGRLIKV